MYNYSGGVGGIVQQFYLLVQGYSDPTMVNMQLDASFGYQAGGFGAQIDAEAQMISYPASFFQSQPSDERNAKVQGIAKDAADLQDILKETRDIINSDRSKLEVIAV